MCRYGVEWRPARSTAVTRAAGRVRVRRLETGEASSDGSSSSRRGQRDHLPAIEGFPACYGRSVHHCRYCDGWEWRDEPLAVLGHGRAGAALSLALLAWSTDVHLFSHGPCRLPPLLRQQLDAHRIKVHEQRIAALEHEDGLLRAVRLRRGGSVHRKALFFTTGQAQRESFARQLGCEFTRKGTVKTDRYGQTCVPGVFVVGDASFDVQFVVVAASEGAKAAVLINKQFQAEAGQAIGS